MSYAPLLTPQFSTAFSESFGETFDLGQIGAMWYLLSYCDQYGIEDIRAVSYVIGTVKWESNFRPVKEKRASKHSKTYMLQSAYWASNYMGRGLIQLTWRKNYALFSRLLKVDLLKNPDLLLYSRQLGAHVAVLGMRDGHFTDGKHKLSMYFPEGQPADYINARKIVNGLDAADKIADLSKKALAVLVDMVGLEKCAHYPL